MWRQLTILTLLLFTLSSCAMSQDESKRRHADTYAIERVYETSGEATLSADIKVRPIPKRHALRLTRESTNGQVIYIEILDRDNRLKAKATWNTTDFRLDFEPFPSGVYYLKLSDFQGASMKYRITKSSSN